MRQGQHGRGRPWLEPPALSSRLPGGGDRSAPMTEQHTNAGNGANGRAHAQLSGFWQSPAWEGSHRRPAVLILENREVNRLLLKGILGPEDYLVYEAASAAQALELLRREKIDLIILDLAIPGIGGLDFCREVKSNHPTRFVPIMILTSIHGEENEIAGMASGADEFLVQPVHPALVRARIRAMLRHKAAIDSLEEAESILLALAQAVEQRDKTTGGHCQRLSKLSIALGTEMGLPHWQIEALYRGGFLHDIGKISIPDAILFKPGPLTEQEWVTMRLHTIRGEEICRPTKSLTFVLPIIRSHHERWDGSGYPDGLAGERIPLLARILQVVDIFDALTSVRPYKRAFTVPEALDILDAETRRGWRDPELVSLLHKFCGKPNGAGTAGLAGPDSVSESLKSMQRALSQFHSSITIPA